MRAFLKIIFALLFSAFVCAHVQAQKLPADADKKIYDSGEVPGQTLRVFAPVTRAGPEIDYITHVPQNMSEIPACVVVYRNEKIYYMPSARGVVKNDGDAFRLRCKAVLLKKGGTYERQLVDELVEGATPNKEFIVELPFTIGLAFTDDDKFGAYEIRTELENLDNSEKAVAYTPITLADWEKPEKGFATQDEWRDAYQNYNVNFSPRDLFELFVSEHARFVSSDNRPDYQTHSFFKNAFERHEFLLPFIDEEFEKGAHELRAKIIILFSLLGKSDKLEGLKDSEKKFLQSVEKVRQALPDAKTAKLSPALIDWLWGEFYACGTYAPVERIAEATRNKKEGDKFIAMTRGKLKEDELNEQEKKLGSLYAVSAWSLYVNMKSPLLRKYLEWMMQTSMTQIQKEYFEGALDFAREMADEKSKKKRQE